MLKKILVGFVMVVAIFLALVSLQPAEFRIERWVEINASREKVFAEINELRRWNAWSPWAHLDPSMKTTYEGAAAGPGSSMSWEGNSEVGTGKMTITESRAPELVRLRLDFLKPFQATNSSELLIETRGGKTIVTWSMTGHNNFVSKAIGLVLNMDKLLGADFEKGLGQLKLITEGIKAIPSAGKPAP